MYDLVGIAEDTIDDHISLLHHLVDIFYLRVYPLDVISYVAVQNT